jgi:hypothetical protein
MIIDNHDILPNKNGSSVKTPTGTTTIASTCVTDLGTISISNGIELDIPKLPTQMPNQMTAEKEQTAKPAIKEENTSDVIQETAVKKEKKRENSDPDDPIAGLDWNDGIATLPGNIICLVNE